MTTTLTIPQALFLLARDDETGKPKGNYNNYIQAGGAMAELVLQNRITLSADRKRRVTVRDASPTGSVFLDAVLARLSKSPRPRTLQHWVSRLSSMSGRVEMIGDELAALGAVERQSLHMFGLFPVTRWPARNGQTKGRLLAEMSGHLFNEHSAINERTASIIALANAGHLLKRNFDRDLLRQHKSNIKSLTRGDWPAAKAARDAIDAVNAAVAASSAVIVAASASG